MKLSTRARYGLKALIDLGLHCETEAVSIQSIASRAEYFGQLSRTAYGET